jgi:hypothetical protein
VLLLYSRLVELYPTLEFVTALCVIQWEVCSHSHLIIEYCLYCMSQEDLSVQLKDVRILLGDFTDD